MGFYIDDKGRILVETYERGENPEEFMFDIFNPEGIFVGRKSLKESKSRFRKFKHNRLYSVYEKESDFEKLKKAYRERSGTLVKVKVNPRLDSLSLDPRFTELLEKMGLD